MHLSIHNISRIKYVTVLQYNCQLPVHGYVPDSCHGTHSITARLRVFTVYVAFKLLLKTVRLQNHNNVELNQQVRSQHSAVGTCSSQSQDGGRRHVLQCANYAVASVLLTNKTRSPCRYDATHCVTGTIKRHTIIICHSVTD